MIASRASKTPGKKAITRIEAIRSITVAIAKMSTTKPKITVATKEATNTKLTTTSTTTI